MKKRTRNKKPLCEVELEHPLQQSSLLFIVPAQCLHPTDPILGECGEDWIKVYDRLHDAIRVAIFVTPKRERFFHCHVYACGDFFKAEKSYEIFDNPKDVLDALIVEVLQLAASTSMDQKITLQQAGLDGYVVH